MIYICVCILICIVFLVIGYYTEKRNVFNPVSLFCGLWAVIMFFSSLQMYSMILADDEINKMILIGIVAYLLGYYFGKLFLQKIHLKIGCYSRYKVDTQFEAVPRYQLLYLLGCVCLVYSMYSLVNVFIQVGGFNLGAIQKMLQSGDYESHNSALLNAMSILIISPVKFALPAITAVDFWYGKRDKKLLIITICLILISMLSSANRTSFLLFFMWLILVAYIKGHHYKRKKSIDSLKTRQKRLHKMKKYIWIFIVIGVIAFVFMTFSRGTSLIFRQIYLYFSMQPRMFEIWAGKIETENICTYGMASILGFIYPIFYVIKNLLGLNRIPTLVQSAYDWTMLTDTLWVWPGRNIFANAYVSIFWFFYLDGRLIGIIFGMFILGCVVSKSYSNIISYQCSARQIAIYCVIFYVIVFSFVRFQFTQSKIVLGLVFIALCAYKMVPKSKEADSK